MLYYVICNVSRATVAYSHYFSHAILIKLKHPIYFLLMTKIPWRKLQFQCFILNHWLFLQTHFICLCTYQSIHVERYTRKRINHSGVRFVLRRDQELAPGEGVILSISRGDDKDPFLCYIINLVCQCAAGSGISCTGSDISCYLFSSVDDDYKQLAL